jgi:hypothetical protein
MVYTSSLNLPSPCSVASAVGAAHLFDGMAARAEIKVNGEIEFAAEYAGTGIEMYICICV